MRGLSGGLYMCSSCGSGGLGAWKAAMGCHIRFGVRTWRFTNLPQHLRQPDDINFTCLLVSHPSLLCLILILDMTILHFLHRVRRRADLINTQVDV